MGTEICYNSLVGNVSDPALQGLAWKLLEIENAHRYGGIDEISRAEQDFRDDAAGKLSERQMRACIKFARSAARVAKILF
jgi:hypothetical protein